MRSRSRHIRTWAVSLGDTVLCCSSAEPGSVQEGRPRGRRSRWLNRQLCPRGQPEPSPPAPARPGAARVTSGLPKLCERQQPWPGGGADPSSILASACPPSPTDPVGVTAPRAVRELMAVAVQVTGTQTAPAALSTPATQNHLRIQAVRGASDTSRGWRGVRIGEDSPGSAELGCRDPGT